MTKVAHTKHGPLPLGGATNRCVKTRSFRILRRSRSPLSSNAIFSEGQSRAGCQGRFQCTCSLAASLHSSILSKKRGKFKHGSYCYAQKCEEALSYEEGSGFAFQNSANSSSSKPLVWNPSYKKRLTKFGVGGENLYYDTSLSALQGTFCGLCDSHDTSVSRRDVLKSLINGRMKNVGFDTGSPGGGGDGTGANGGKGYGGSDGDNNFGENDSWGWNAFFLTGIRGWVFIAAALTLVTSIFAQIFRSAGHPTSRTTGGKADTPTSGESTGGNEPDGVKLHLHKGGSLSHASSGRSFRGNPNKSPRKEPSSPLASFSFSRQSPLWSRDEESNELQYRRLFQGLLYPPPQAAARAYHRRTVRMVGPKPGDWVEDVDSTEANNNESLNPCSPTTNDGCHAANIHRPSTEAEQALYEEEVRRLKEELKELRKLQKLSEDQQHEALKALKENSQVFEEKESALRKRIKNQEETNETIRKRLSHIETERVTLARMLEDAKSSLAGVNPAVDSANGQMNELSKEVQTFKTNLRLMEKQLVSTSRERDAVVRRMEALLRDVNDMEQILEVVQKSQDLIIGRKNEEFSDKVKKADDCIHALRQYDLKPTNGRHLSPILEVSQRVVMVFNKLLSEMKRSFIQSSKCVQRIKDIQTDLSEKMQSENDLQGQLSILKEQHERIQTEKETSESLMASLQNELVTVHEQLDNTSGQEDNLRESIKKLTSDKDELSSMARKMQREIDDIETLLNTLENTRNLILQSIPSEMGAEHITMLENCLSGLQQQQMNMIDSSSPVTQNITNRLMGMFDGLLVQTKQCLLRSEEAKKSLKRVEEDLAGALSQEDSLNMTVEGLKASLEEMTSSKSNLANDVSLLKNEMEEKARSIDQLKMELSELDQAREAQTKDIESLQEDLEDKKAQLQDSKKAEVEMIEAIEIISAERDELLTKLESNELDLDHWKSSLEELVAEHKKIQEEREALLDEKNKLETHIAGLTHRISDFESETNRLNQQILVHKEILGNEQTLRETLEQENEVLIDEREDCEERFNVELDNFKGQLANVLADRMKLEEACHDLEEANSTLKRDKDNEIDSLRAQIEDMEDQIKCIEAGPSSPLAEAPVPIPESPFCEEERRVDINSDIQNRSESFLQSNDGHDIGGSPSQYPLSQEITEDAAEIEIEEGLPDIPQQEDSKVQSWLENAEAVDPYGSVPPSERHDEPTGEIEQNADEIIESLMPAAGGINEKRIYRRCSWPQDMTNELSDNLFGAAQELVDMTAATLALAADKNEIETELNDIRQSNTETKAQLEEREAEVSELTEHFLQVYQIASDLATDNEEQTTEIRDLKIMYERQKQDIEAKDHRLTYLETEYAKMNKAPPRIPITTTHYPESASSFPTNMSSKRRSRDYTAELNSRGNSLAAMSGFESYDTVGRSPRLDAPETPSMLSGFNDITAQRAQSSATNISLPSRHYDEAEVPSVAYTSLDDMSSLSGASNDDGSTNGYPETEHYPAHVNMMTEN